jgi:ubiquilin
LFVCLFVYSSIMSGEAPAASDGDKITVQIKCSNDTKYPISIARSATILELKQALVEPADCPVERQRLIYSGRVLKNEETVQSYKIGDGHIVHMVKGAATTGKLI